MKIVADKDIPFLEGVFEPYAKVEYIKGDEISHDDVIDADVLIVRTRTQCNADRSYRPGLLCLSRNHGSQCCRM